MLAPLDEPRDRRDATLPLALARPRGGLELVVEPLARRPGDADVVRLLGGSGPGLGGRSRGSDPGDASRRPSLVTGQGYVELTGYAASMQGVF